jgi:hypothetical protein
MTQSTIQPWHFSGDFFESCNCEVNCPCGFGTPAHYDSCDVNHVFHISSGRYGDVTLDALNFALAFRTPKRMSDGNWLVAIYIDQRATRPQRQALERIASGEAGGGFTRRKSLTGTLLGVKYVPINYESVGRRRKVTIPNALTMEVEAVPGARPDEDVQLVNLPRAGETGGYPTTVAKAVAHSFSDYGLSWDNTGKNGYYRRVEMAGP